MILVKSDNIALPNSIPFHKIFIAPVSGKSTKLWIITGDIYWWRYSDGDISHWLNGDWYRLV